MLTRLLYSTVAVMTAVTVVQLAAMLVPVVLPYMLAVGR